LMRLPGRVAAGSEEARLVLNLDLAPTLLALAGWDVPAEMAGGDLLGLLEGAATPWREDFHYLYDFEPPFPTPAVEAIRSERWKYVAARGESPQLFDLVADPGEYDDLLARGEGAEIARALAARLDTERSDALANR